MFILVILQQNNHLSLMRICLSLLSHLRIMHIKVNDTGVP